MITIYIKINIYMRKVRITESQLKGLVRKMIKEETKKNLINEDYFSDTERAYIGRTDAYYSDEDDDSVYSPDYWTYSTDINDSDFAQDGELYQLSKDGKQIINSWLANKGRNEYQRTNARMSGASSPIMGMSNEELWKYLTTDRRYSRQLRKGFNF
jgi:hypothetical protein